jgi:hypothetical protein
MIRLNIAAEPFWLDLSHGVRVKVPPLTAAIMMAARSDPAVADLPDDTPLGVRSLAFCKAVGRLTIQEWDGVGDMNGDPVAPSPAGIDALLDLYPMFEAFEIKYVAGQGLALDAEKNAFAPSPNGISAGANDIAPPAKGNAPNVPRS